LAYEVSRLQIVETPSLSVTRRDPSYSNVKFGQIMNEEDDSCQVFEYASPIINIDRKLTDSICESYIVRPYKMTKLGRYSANSHGAVNQVFLPLSARRASLEL